MFNWKDYFQNWWIIDVRGDEDLLYQVGTTVRGKPISNHQFVSLIESIEKGLQLSKNDILLDLCCGNGVKTYELAKKVKTVIGVDFSKPYIENAIKYKNANNISYVCSDITNLNQINEATKGKLFNKVLIYDALAFLTPVDLENILFYLNKQMPLGASIMIGAVLDKQRRWNFFDTIKRKIIYFINYKLLLINIGLGRWWTKQEIDNISSKHGLSCRFIDQNPILHTAHYRFDVIITKQY